MSKILVLGGQGQLGQALASESAGDGRFVFLTSEEADITDEEQLKQVFEKHEPTCIVNCAAYTAVDKAEDEPLLAARLNADALLTIAGLCKRYGADLVHISTDFVFEGTQAYPLGEGDLTKPIGVYGKTKLAGEENIQKLVENFIIIRTSWLYSEFGHNFAKTMLRLAKERDSIKVVADQVGTPTYARDLAKGILQIINQPDKVYGVFHYSNEGVASWYDFAHEIVDLSGNAVQVAPIKSEEFPTKAQRPSYSVLDKSKIKAAYRLSIPHWRDSLKVCLEYLKHQT